MFRFTTHFLLLLVITSSQVLSGISCCCLARNLPAAWNGSVEMTDVAPKLPVPRCAKCRSQRAIGEAGGAGQAKNRLVTKHHAAPRHSSSTLQSPSSSCSCVKPQHVASPTDDLIYRVAPAPAWFAWTCNLVPSSTSASSLLDRYELPARFGGETWQAIACVWRN